MGVCLTSNLPRSRPARWLRRLRERTLPSLARQHLDRVLVGRIREFQQQRQTEAVAPQGLLQCGCALAYLRRQVSSREIGLSHDPLRGEPASSIPLILSKFFVHKHTIKQPQRFVNKFLDTRYWLAYCKDNDRQRPAGTSHYLPKLPITTTNQTSHLNPTACQRAWFWGG